MGEFCSVPACSEFYCELECMYKYFWNSAARKMSSLYYNSSPKPVGKKIHVVLCMLQLLAFNNISTSCFNLKGSVLWLPLHAKSAKTVRNRSRTHSKIDKNPVICNFVSILLLPWSSRVAPRCQDPPRMRPRC